MINKSHLKNNKLWFYIFLIIPLYIGCMPFGKDDDSASGVVETGNAIVIAGRVINEANEPMPGITVRLHKKGLSDVTDSEGNYKLEGDLNSLAKISGSEDEVLDTVIFEKADQKLAKRYITKWVDNLPDVKIIQRDFSGSIFTDRDELGKVEAVLLAGEGEKEILLVKEFFYNTSVEEYSGYIFFANSNSVNSYDIYINVYDVNEELLGRSDTVHFNDNAGDVKIPNIRIMNSLPIAYADLYNRSASDSVYLYGGGSDKDGEIVKKEWKIGDGEFEETLDSIIAIYPPEYCCEPLLCIFRVTDDDGNIALDSIYIETESNLPPLVSIKVKYGEPGSDSVYLYGEASDEDGEIVKKEWKIGDGEFELTSDGTISVSVPENCCEPLLCIFRAMDDDGNLAYDSVYIKDNPEDPDVIDNNSGALKKVLLYLKAGGWNNQDPARGLTGALEKLTVKYQFEFYGTNDESVLSDLDSYDLVIYFSANADQSAIEESSKQALIDYINNGGAWLGLYMASDHGGNWGWYGDTLLSGAQFDMYEEKTVTLAVDEEAMSDPALSNMWSDSESDSTMSWKGKIFEFIQDEDFDLRNDPDVTVIQKVMPEDEAYPDQILTWTKKIGNGRMLYTSLGANEEDYLQNDEWLTNMLWYYMNYLIGEY